jgi:hypothetical protein
MVHKEGTGPPIPDLLRYGNTGLPGVTEGCEVETGVGKEAVEESRPVKERPDFKAKERQATTRDGTSQVAHTAVLAVCTASWLRDEEAFVWVVSFALTVGRRSS